MKIISKFQDYYDKALEHGFDPNIVYKRDNVLLPWPSFVQNRELATLFDEWFSFERDTLIKASWKFSLAIHRQRPDPVTFNVPSTPGNLGKNKLGAYLFVVGFCGKLHRGVMLTKPGEYSIQPEKDIPCYSVQAIRDVEERTGFQAPLGVSRWRNGSFDTWFKKPTPRSYQEWCIKHRVPIISWESLSYSDLNKNVLLNGPLKTYEFFRVFNPYQTMQELSQYISGVLGSPGAVMVEIEDKYKIAEHGFDKWSFRKQGKNSKI